MISIVNVKPGIQLVGEFWQGHFTKIWEWEQKFHRHTEAAWVRGEGLKLSHRRFVQATVQTNSFEKEQRKFAHEQGLFEREDRVLRVSITKSEHEMRKYCPQIEKPRSWIKIGKKLWSLVFQGLWLSSHSNIEDLHLRLSTIFLLLTSDSSRHHKVTFDPLFRPSTSSFSCTLKCNSLHSGLFLVCSLHCWLLSISLLWPLASSIHHRLTCNPLLRPLMALYPSS